MNLIIISLSHFFHLLATVIWIGGIFMVLFVIIPGARSSLEPGAMTGLMKETTRKFTPLANLSILVMVITGVILAVYGKKSAGFFNVSNIWSGILFFKHIIVALMIIIHFYRGLILAPRIGTLSAQPAGSTSLPLEIAKLQKLSLNLVKTNMVLGMFVLLASAASMSHN